MDHIKEIIVHEVKNLVSALPEHRLNIEPPVEIKYAMEDNLSCILRVRAAAGGTPRYFEISVKERI
jgi:hypothetical protein